MGLEPTNLLTASQALYQLSYAPSGEVNVSSRRRSPRTLGLPASRTRRERPYGLAYPGGMARAYDVVAIEEKWQRHWEEEGTYRIDNDDPREKYYALCMYPYPSGAAHQGHVRNYTFGDLAVRYQTMLGQGRAQPLRVRLVRPPGRERRHQDGDPPPDVHRGPHRRAEVLPRSVWGPSTTGAGRCAATTPPTSTGPS